MAVRACAVGQASAAIFARHAAGRSAQQISQSLTELEAWLAHDGELPDWPGLAVLEPARAYPARHGAMLLPWKAAVAALSSTAPAG
jgi:NifU-like protein involved in Fe-S cluster formation